RHFRDAVEVAERRLEGQPSAGALNGLGTAYLDRVAGDPDEDVERAIECLARAMEGCRGSALVGESARVCRGQAAAYLKRERGAGPARTSSGPGMSSTTTSPPPCRCSRMPWPSSPGVTRRTSARRPR